MRILRVAPKGWSEALAGWAGSAAKSPAATFSCLSTAIDQAQDGDRVVISPGRYLGGFRIERDIELVASEPCSPMSGMQPTVEIQGTSDHEWVLCCEADVTVRGVQLTSFWRKACVVVDRGKLDISACSIHGAFFFGGQARGKVIDNEIDGRGHSVPTVTVFESATPTISHNLITNSGEHGLYISGVSTPLVQHNEILSHRRCGIVISGSSTAVVKENLISDNSFAGVSVTGLANPTITKNSINENMRYNVVVSSQAAPVISENKIFRSRGWGISCEGESSAKVMNNQIYENQLAGFKIGPAATAFIHGGNKLYNNGDHEVPSHHDRETFQWK